MRSRNICAAKPERAPARLRAPAIDPLDLRPSGIPCDIAVLDVTDVTQALVECGNEMSECPGEPGPLCSVRGAKDRLMSASCRGPTRPLRGDR